MKQVESRSNCLLYLGAKVDPDKVDPRSIYPPGDRCFLCPVKSGIAGEDGYGVIRLSDQRDISPEREVRVCPYRCEVPPGVTVKIDPHSMRRS